MLVSLAILLVSYFIVNAFYIHLGISLRHMFQERTLDFS